MNYDKVELIENFSGIKLLHMFFQETSHKPKGKYSESIQKNGKLANSKHSNLTCLYGEFTMAATVLFIYWKINYFLIYIFNEKMVFV